MVWRYSGLEISSTEKKLTLLLVRMILVILCWTYRVFEEKHPPVLIGNLIIGTVVIGKSTNFRNVIMIRDLVFNTNWVSVSKNMSLMAVYSVCPNIIKFHWLSSERKIVNVSFICSTHQTVFAKKVAHFISSFR